MMVVMMALAIGDYDVRIYSSSADTLVTTK